jgi:guanylate kinase
MPITLEPEGMLIAVVSPSGGGKSTICRALLDADPKLEYSISVTSRPPREGEVDGRDYHFVSEERFQELIAEGLFYEWARVHDNLYGTRRDLVETQLARGKDVVLDIDVVGSLNIKKMNDKAVLIFILPPSMQVLEGRLRRRETDSDEVIRKRLENAREEIRVAGQYDYVVINDDLEQAIVTVRGIINAERHAAKRLKVRYTGGDSELSNS